MSCILNAIRSCTSTPAEHQHWHAANSAAPQSHNDTAWKVAKVALGAISLATALISGTAFLATGAPIAFISAAISSIAACCLFSNFNISTWHVSHHNFRFDRTRSETREQRGLEQRVHVGDHRQIGHHGQPGHQRGMHLYPPFAPAHMAVPAHRWSPTNRVAVGNRGQVQLPIDQDPEARVPVGDNSTL